MIDTEPSESLPSPSDSLSSRSLGVVAADLWLEVADFDASVCERRRSEVRMLV